MAGYTTIVFAHGTEKEARALFAEISQKWPFMQDTETTRITGFAASDLLSITDAIRMACDSRAINDDETVDLIGELLEVQSWQEAQKTFQRWDLSEQDGELVSA